MRIIDAKGRLFGIINVIDLGVIAAFIVFGYISFNLVRNAKLGYPIEIEAKVLFPSLPIEAIEKLEPDSKLLRFKVIKPYIEKDGNRFADVHAWVKLSVRVKDVPLGNRGHKVAAFFLKGRELNIDDLITFTTANYSIRSILLNINGMDREIEVVLRPDFSDEIIDAIKVGDSVIRWGHLTGEVLAKEYTVDGRVKVKLHIKRGEVSLKIGEEFPFETERYYVYGNIVKSVPWEKD